MANTYDTPSDAGVYKMEWETKLQERLNKPQTWKEICNVIYTNSYSVNVPYMSTVPSVTTGTRGTAYTFADFALTNQAMTISSKFMIPMYVDRAELAQCKYVQQMELAELQGSLLNERIETSVLTASIAATDMGLVNGAIALGTGAITVSASNIDDIIRAVKREIATYNGQDLAARNGIFFVWRPADFELLEAKPNIGLSKSPLIDLETQKWATGGKQVSPYFNGFTLQPERLNMGTSLIGKMR